VDLVGQSCAGCAANHDALDADGLQRAAHRGSVLHEQCFRLAAGSTLAQVLPDPHYSPRMIGLCSPEVIGVPIWISDSIFLVRDRGN